MSTTVPTATPEAAVVPEQPLQLRALSVLLQQMALVILVLLIIVSEVIAPRFLSGTNLQGLALEAPIFGVLAAGQMLAILTGGIDLSIGSVTALTAFFAATMSFHSLALAIIVPIVVGACVGLINGVGIAFTRVPPFIITLAMLSLARGVALQSAAIYQGSNGGAGASPVDINLASGFANVATGTVLGVPYAALILIAVFIGMAYLLRYTRLGRHIYAVGGNEMAASLLGVRVRRVKVMVYMISGGLAGLAGMLLASKVQSAPPTAATGYEFEAITAVVIGGTLLTGGVGTMRGTFIGVLIITILPNIFNLVGVSQAWQAMTLGIVLLLVVLLQVLSGAGTTIGGLKIRLPNRPHVM